VYKRNNERSLQNFFASQLSHEATSDLDLQMISLNTSDMHAY